MLKDNSFPHILGHDQEKVSKILFDDGFNPNKVGEEKKWGEEDLVINYQVEMGEGDAYDTTWNKEANCPVTDKHKKFMVNQKKNLNSCQ